MKNNSLRKYMVLFLTVGLLFVHFNLSVNAQEIKEISLQEIISTLPEEVTNDNLEDVVYTLTMIDQEKSVLSDEELALIDFSKYSAAIAAINVLQGQPGAEVPMTVMQIFVKTVNNKTITLEVEPENWYLSLLKKYKARILE